MVFTDPIIAGEELTRQAIKSDNYLPGISGWRIARDGASEFDNIGIRNTLWTPSIMLNGRPIQENWNTLARGTVTWTGGLSSISTTSEEALAWLEVDVQQGRWYELSLTDISADQGNTKAIEFGMRATYGNQTSSWPTRNTGELLTISLRLSQFELGSLRRMWGAPYTGKLRLVATIRSLDAQNVRSWAPGAGLVFCVIDHGVTPPQAGGMGIVPPGKTVKEFTITANASKIYYGNGAGYPYSPPYDQRLYQGYNGDDKGDRRSWFTFDSGGVAQLSDMAGVPLSDVITVELFLDCIFLSSSSTPPVTGHLTLGFHNKTSVGSSEPSGGVANRLDHYLTAMAPVWVDLKEGGDFSGSLVESIRSGYTKGFMVGAAGNLTRDYLVVYSGVGPDIPVGSRPKLHCKYFK